MLVVVYTMELGYPTVESSPVKGLSLTVVLWSRSRSHSNWESFAPFKQLAVFKRLAKPLVSYIVLKKKARNHC